MISKKIFKGDGTITRFLSDFLVRSEQFCRPYVFIYDDTISSDVLQDGTTDQTNWRYPDNLWKRLLNVPNSNDIVTVDKWQIVDNSIAYYLAPPADSTVWIEVATTSEEFGETLTQPSVEQAQEAARLAKKWAEGTEPGGTGTKSSKQWSEESQTLGAVEAQKAKDEADRAKTEADKAEADAAKVHQSIPTPVTPSDEGLALVAHVAGNQWEKILGLPLETGNKFQTVTNKGVEGDSYWMPAISCPKHITADFSLEAGQNGILVNPTVDQGVTITIPTGSTLAVIGGTI